MPHSLFRPFCLFLVLCCALLSLAQAAEPDSAPLQTRIANLLAADNDAQENQPTLHIRIVTPQAKLAGLCPAPDLRLSGHPVRLTGNRSVIAKCGNKQQFIQIKVSATGQYWIAAHTLTPGQVVREGDIQAVTGELDKLPAGLLLDVRKIIGSTPTRIIRPGQPLSDNQLRRRWAVVANRDVEIVAPGDGFLIHAKGKALDNAAQDESVRIRTRTGRVVTATVVAEGTVSINLDN
ncbi:flagellar basal body P-ring formation chaperone FlgA [Kosakonia sp. H02]|nr:flagellar basal body P-ring formation chaperone FlgA [Kosakonia sp. H02]